MHVPTPHMSEVGPSFVLQSVIGDTAEPCESVAVLYFFEKVLSSIPGNEKRFLNDVVNVACLWEDNREISTEARLSL